MATDKRRAEQGRGADGNWPPTEESVVTDIATLVLDHQLQLRLFTGAAAEMFNLDAADRGCHLSKLSEKLPAQKGLVADAEHVLQTLTSVEREVPSGKEQRYFLRVCPYQAADNTVEGVVVTVEDTTSRHEVEEALAESRERYRLLVESTKEYAMFVMDEHARIVMWNNGAERILGYREEEVLGRSGAIIFTPEDRAKGEVEEELRIAREEGQAMNERWHLRKDRSRFWGSGVVTSLWESDQLRGYAKVMRDNTKRRLAAQALRKRERELAELNETLEERVQTRTAQVRRLASELVTTEQTVRQRIARTLHDNLQQLLYAAEMQIQFTREDLSAARAPASAEGPSEESAAQKAIKQMDELAQIITESLRLTRQLTVELSPPVLQENDLQETLAWLANHVQEAYDLQVKVDASDEQWVTTTAQRMLLFEVVRELLFNVVKHAGTQEAHVTVGKEEEGLTVTVRDAGRGFDVEVVMDKRNGGFGLRSVRERMALFDGRVKIESQPGEGTRVTLHLPDVEETSAQIRAEEAPDA